MQISLTTNCYYCLNQFSKSIFCLLNIDIDFKVYAKKIVFPNDEKRQINNENRNSLNMETF